MSSKLSSIHSEPSNSTSPPCSGRGSLSKFSSTHSEPSNSTSPPCSGRGSLSKLSSIQVSPSASPSMAVWSTSLISGLKRSPEISLIVVSSKFSSIHSAPSLSDRTKSFSRPSTQVEPDLLLRISSRLSELLFFLP